MQSTEIPSHVYARIAEHVSKELGVDTTVDEVASVLGGFNPPSIRDRNVLEEIMNEAKEYGIA